MSATVLEHGAHHTGGHSRGLLARSRDAAGVVYGDIGTSPLYAAQVALAALGHAPKPEDALGIASLIIWALLIVVAIKYIFVVLRADIQGEGGILVLLQLVKAKDKCLLSARTFTLLTLGGILGASFLYGDGVITPAISVLSAMEGIKVVWSQLSTDVILCFATVILTGLFIVQRSGTAKIGGYFGPVMLFWFVTIALIGAWQIWQHPVVLNALNPYYALHELASENIVVSFAVFGCVFLALTGGEALYADMGHVGKDAIRLTFFSLVLPALVLNYLGQAALVMNDPSAVDNPFYKCLSTWGVLPMVLLAGAATIIASQALISGAYSLTQQAIQMGLLPRLTIKQTSSAAAGQIYVPVVNWVLFVGTLVVVFLFRTSDALAAAYGIAVSGTMLITTLLLYFVMTRIWNVSTRTARIVIGFFALIDLNFFVSNSLKIPQGGWLPLAIGAVLCLVMWSWRTGTQSVRQALTEMSETLADFLAHVDDGSIVRTGGCAVWLTKVTNDNVSALLRQAARNFGSLHKNVILFTIEPARVPRVAGIDRIVVRDLGHGFMRVILRVGFMERARIEAAVAVVLNQLRNEGVVNVDPHQVKYFIGNETVHRMKSGSPIALPIWLVYSFLRKFATRPTDFYRLPDNRVQEVGIRIEV
jgi:KUP system potassium uptake protein